MKKNRSVFIDAYEDMVTYGRVSLAKQLLIAFLIACATVVFCVAVPMLLPISQYALPTFWTSEPIGIAYIYTLIALLSLALWQMISGRAFGYREITLGRWAFLKGCGSDLRPRLLAKYFSEIWPACFTYLVGAVLVSLAAQVFYSDEVPWTSFVQVLVLGLLLVMVLVLLEAFLTAIGANKMVRTFVLLLVLLGEAYLLYQQQYIGNITSLQALFAVLSLIRLDAPSLSWSVLLLLVLSFVMTMVLPERRIQQMSHERLKEEMLPRMGITKEMDVFVKQGDSVEQLVSGKDLTE